MSKHKMLNKIYAKNFQALFLSAMSLAKPKHKIQVTAMSGKLDGFSAINTNTLSIGFCNDHCSYGDNCYSKIMLKGHRQSCIPKWEINGQILSKSIVPFAQLPKIKTKVCRINAHGELINYTHLENIMRICKANPNVVFGLWTKRYDLIKQYAENWQLPKNCKLIFSNSAFDKPMKSVPKYFHKTFSNITKSNQTINCDGACAECMLCYTENNTSHIVEELKSKESKNTYRIT